MLLVIQTQNQENYGAHDWDGRGECPQYWKMKGGNEIKVQGVEVGMDYQQIVESLRDQIEESNNFYRVSIIGYSVEADSYLSWFEQSQLDYDGEILFKEPVIEYQKTVDKLAV
jgi:hypothetical protein